MRPRLAHFIPTAFALLLAAVTLAKQPGWPSQPTRQPNECTMSVNGTARVDRVPDFVDVSFAIVASDTTAAAVQTIANKSMEAAFAAVRALKLANQDLQTGTVELSPRYAKRADYSDDSQPPIIGYTATITVRVRTSDLKSAPKIIEVALAAGCNRVDYVTFGIKEAIAAREEAIKLAAQAAKRKASVLAESLELRIVRVESAGTSSYMGGWYGGRSNAVAQMTSNRSSASPLGGDESGESPVVPGKVEVWAEANITFIAAPVNEVRSPRPQP